MNLKSTLLALVVLLTIETSMASVQRFRCIITADPSTTMTVGFEQYDGTFFDPFDDEGTPTLYFDTTPHGGDASQYAFSQGSDRVIDFKGMDNNFVRLTGLSPNTRYYFIVQDDQETSPVYFFETLPNDPSERLSIIAGGDSRDIPVLDDDIGRQNANRLVAKLRAHCVLFGGDMTLTDDATSPVDIDEWPEWFDDWQLSIATDGRITPLIPARGNHELGNNSIYDLFDVPNPNIYYSIEIGGGLLQTITLNSEISRLGDQLTWLDNTLANTCATWKVVQYHRPTRPHESDKDEQDDQADHWSPLFEQHGVQLVIESDAHLCKYTQPLRRTDDAGNTEGFIRDDENGVVYIGEGGWGAELRDVDDAKDWTMASGSFNQFKWLFIDQNGIEIRTVNTDNADNVTPKTDADSKFSMPNNINIWNPTVTSAPSGLASYNGGVLTLNNPTTSSVNLGNDFSFLAGTTTTLDAGSGYDSYLWSTGATSQTISVGAPGTYQVTVTNNGCTASDEIMIETFTTGVEELDKDVFQFSVSPNPTDGIIVAQIIAEEFANMQLTLLNAEGKKVLAKNIRINSGVNQEEISLNHLSNGIYFIILEMDGAIQVEKFVLSK